MSVRLLRALLALCLMTSLLGLALGAHADPGEHRIALVIGNSSYNGEGVLPLKNPKHDAIAMARTLQSLGFTVTQLLDANRTSMRDTVHDFAGQVAKDGPDTVALFYYSGHGMQVDGRNYLIPVSVTSLPDAADIDDYAYPVSRALDEIQNAGARVNILILDACRDNPYAANRGLGGKGLAKIQQNGIYIAYATADGQTADDNSSGENGLYTQELLKALRTPGLDIHQMFQMARRQVVAATQGAQYPYDYDGLLADDFYFAGAPPQPRARPVADHHLNSDDQAAANSALTSLWGTPDKFDLEKAKSMTTDSLQNALDAGADIEAKNNDGITTLIVAAIVGNVDAVRFLLAHGADVNATMNNRATALIGAAILGDTGVGKLLLDHGAEVNAKRDDGRTALMTAARCGSADFVQFLLDHGAEVNAKDSDGKTAVAFAKNPTDDVTADTKARILAILKAAGGTEDGSPTSRHLSPDDQTAANDAFIAIWADPDKLNLQKARSMTTDALQKALDSGADINAHNSEGFTALMVAAIINNLDVMRYLITHGANVNAGAKSGATALIAAAVIGQIDTARMLLDYGADINAKGEDGETALMTSAHYGTVDYARFLLHRGADINIKTADGKTAIDLARSPDGDVTAATKSKMIALLLGARSFDDDAPVHHLSPREQADANTALIALWADSDGTPNSSRSAALTAESLKRSLDAGADVNARSANGMTTMMALASNNNTDSAKFLIDRGADLNATDHLGLTALMDTAVTGSLEVGKALIAHGVDVNYREKHGFSALMLAAHFGHPEMVRLLLDRGADISVKDSQGGTVLLLAENPDKDVSSDTKDQIVSMLKAAGASD